MEFLLFLPKGRAESGKTDRNAPKIRDRALVRRRGTPSRMVLDPGLDVSLLELCNWKPAAVFAEVVQKTHRRLVAPFADRAVDCSRARTDTGDDWRARPLRQGKIAES